MTFALVLLVGAVTALVLEYLRRIVRAVERVADAQEIAAASVCLKAQRDGLTLHVPDAPPEDL